MILLDASIIIDGLRAKDAHLINQLIAIGGAISGPTRAEVLSGARSANDRTRLLTVLDAFQQVSIPDAIWDTVGDLQSQLRLSGVTVPLVDAVLAAVALSLNVEIWARDADFYHLQRVIPALKLYAESP
jgi:predicted nucleic acid-binding protein